jgi:DNA-binding transcriptional ArsR family regulator
MTYALALQALADPTRRTIFERLRAGPRPVGELASGLPVSRPAVSQHLRVLREARLVREQRQGTRNLYRIEGAGLEELRTYLEGYWGEVLDAFKQAAEGKAKGGRNGRTNAARRPKKRGR